MSMDLPKWVQIAIVLVIAIVALLVFSSQDRLHVYGTYLREKSPESGVSFWWTSSNAAPALSS